MGYTHYWSRPKKVPAYKFTRAATDCWRLTQFLDEQHGVKVVFDFDEPDRPPKFAKDEIWFNGIGEEGHETFVVPFDGLNKDDFCKTARKPYDLMVCCALIILTHHLGETFEVSSDGDNDEENWPKAREVCQQLLGYGRDFWLPPKGVVVRSKHGLVPELDRHIDERRYRMAEYRFPCSNFAIQWIRQAPLSRRYKVINLWDRTIQFEARNMATARWWATIEALKRTLPEEALTSTVIAVLEGAKRTPGEWSGIWAVTDEILEYGGEEVWRAFRYRLPRSVCPCPC